MARTSDDYRHQLSALLPPGRAWPRDAESNIEQFLAAWADGFARFDRRADDLLDETDPRTTLEMLPDWEAVAGLPDPCVGPFPTLAQRRASLVAQLTARGGQSVQYFVGVAAALGFAITIGEPKPFTCMTPIDQPLYGEDWAFAWQVHAPATTIFEFTCMSGCDEPLRVWGNTVLECTIRRLSPAHTIPLFIYG